MKNIRYNIQLLALCLMATPALAGAEVEKSLPEYEVTGSTADASLKKTEAQFTFTFFLSRSKQSLLKTQPVQLAYNGVDNNVTTDAKGMAKVKLKPGKYVFELYYDGYYTEVVTDSIKVRPGMNTSVRVYFQYRQNMKVAEKPVIYLYPEKTTEVQVQLAIKGDFLYTYPTYNNGWNVTADPDGTLHQGDQTFGYLFWEGETQIDQNLLAKGDGFNVSTADLTAFFEARLSHLGLNSKEQQDFITYWVPRMQKAPQHFVRFLVNDAYDPCAQLTVTPKPDHNIRVFMLWLPLETGETITAKEQELPTLKREGFTLVEWGGTEMKLSQALLNE